MMRRYEIVVVATFLGGYLGGMSFPEFKNLFTTNGIVEEAKVRALTNRQVVQPIIGKIGTDDADIIMAHIAGWLPPEHWKFLLKRQREFKKILVEVIEEVKVALKTTE